MVCDNGTYGLFVGHLLSVFGKTVSSLPHGKPLDTYDNEDLYSAQTAYFECVSHYSFLW